MAAESIKRIKSKPGRMARSFAASITSRTSKRQSQPPAAYDGDGSTSIQDSGHFRHDGSSSRRHDSGAGRRRDTGSSRGNGRARDDTSSAWSSSTRSSSSYRRSSVSSSGSSWRSQSPPPKKSARKPAKKAARPAATASKPKVVMPKYPKPIAGVQWRANRVQTLTPDHEIVLKQVWCTLLKYWGYSVDIDPVDIKHKESFVASTMTGGNADPQLSRMSTHNSSIATKGKYHQDTHVPRDSRRILDIQAKCYNEQYQPVATPRDDIINVFVNHHHLNFQSADEYDDDQGVDEQSVESFVTASSEMGTPEDADAALDRTYDEGAALKTVAKTPREDYPSICSALSGTTPAKSNKVLFDWQRTGLPDNEVLKWVRARKYNTDDTLTMLGKTIDWRASTPADEWLYEGDAKSYLTGTNQGFIKNFTVEKSWIKGQDSEGNPVFWFQAKKHFGSDAPEAEMVRYVVVLMEWARLFTRDVSKSVDCLSIVFDLTGFSLKNADYSTIKFLVEALEAHYPESLGILIIYNAPWIFSTVWNIIKHWIDPGVAAKIHFCKNFKEINRFIPKEDIPVSFGGTDGSGPDYPKPQQGDDLPPKDRDATYARLMRERDVLYMRFLDATRRWVECTNPEVSSKYLEEKIGLGTLLSNNYIALDPYLRCPGVYDRKGILNIGN
ncbi:hypothetical protein DICA0_A09098 [Diutina catenulata]